MKNRYYGLLNIINRSPQRFLRSLSDSELPLLCSQLRLLSDEIDLIRSLHNIAQTSTDREFEDVLLGYTAAHPGIFPLRSNRWDVQSTEELQQTFESIVAGKRIVLVGPSSSLAGKSYGPEIDKFQLVARINFQWPVPQAMVPDVGQRLDILYHCCNGDRSIREQLTDSLQESAVICYQNNIDARLLIHFCVTHGLPRVDISSMYRQISCELGIEARTGIVAIAHLLQFPVAGLHITGLTCADTYYPSYKRSANAFDQERADARNLAERVYLRKITESDPRVTMDEQLEAVLANREPID